MRHREGLIGLFMIGLMVLTVRPPMPAVSATAPVVYLPIVMRNFQ